MSQLSLERAILSETLCAFMVTLTVMAFQRMLLERNFGPRACAILGTLAALTGLTRPLYAYLAPLLFILLVMPSAQVSVARGERVRRLTSFAAPAGGLLLGWCLFNWMSIGYFGLTTEIGLSLLNHSGAFIELAPDKYAAIRDPFLKSRAINGGSQVNAYFGAQDEMLKRTGYTQLQLMSALTKMSLELFAAHPILYAKGVIAGWLGFWRPPLPRWRPFYAGSVEDALQAPAPADDAPERALARTGNREIRALVWVNLMFLASAAWLAVRFAMGREPWGFDLSVITIVLAAALFQAMVEFGDASRFSAPTAPLVLYTVAVSGWRLLAASRAGAGVGASVGAGPRCVI